MRTFLIDQMQPEDWPFVRQIYLDGIATGMATFEIEAPSWEAWDASHLICGRLVARHDRDVMGWTALSPVSARKVYAGVAEVTIYVGENYRRTGVGRALLERLISESNKVVSGRYRPWYFQKTLRRWRYTRAAAFAR